LFVGTTLEPVVGIDQRSNPALARMLTDFAHERWAAKRPVSPELWRCVGPHADDGMLADLQKVLTTGSDVERRAAALALASCPRPEADQILKESPELEEGVRDGTITWSKVAAQVA
ncbi:MAG TPA: EboA domain-containing protein, partial [Planctomycetaceae bacterium]|nr:EboA domain-containing protein [Planctomycetaceae bacterium]